MVKRTFPPRSLEFFLRRLAPLHHIESLSGDFAEIFERILRQKGKARALLWYFFHVLKLIPSFIENKIYGSADMIRSYSKVAFRSFLRHKGFSLINISGLALGLACSILILIWVQNELSYDGFHAEADRIHRVILNYGDKDSFGPHGPGALGPALKREYPEIIDSVRFFFVNKNPLRYKDKVLNGALCGTDPSMTQIFTFPFVMGDPKKALVNPRSIVLTETMAEKLFGQKNPLGETLGFEWWGRWHDFTVTGIVEDVTPNSHIQFEYLLPFSFVTLSGMDIESWDAIAYHTYVLLNEDVDEQALAHKIVGIYKRHLPDSPYTVHLEPLRHIHLYNDAGGGAITYVYLFGIIGLFILGIACVNFMNLSTARSANRALEVGMRKVMGSNRSQLITQFLSESVLMALVAFCFAVVVVKALLPTMSNLTDTHMDMTIFGPRILVFLGIALLTGLFSGSYPALFLSKVLPVKVLKGFHVTGGRNLQLRRYLVIAQFVISILLIFGSVIVYEQLTYIRNKDLGFDKEHIVNFELRGGLRKNFRSIKQELVKNPNILAICTTNGSFFRRFATDKAVWEGKKEGERLVMAIHSVDYNYADVFDIQMVQGRYFSEEFSTDISEGIIVNETALKAMGLEEEPIGTRFFCPMPFNMSKEGKIIGVVKDFHFRSLHKKIEPLILAIAPGWHTDMYVKMRSQDLPATIAHVEKTFKAFAPDYVLEFSFLDESLDSLYKTEMRLGSLIKYGSVIAIFIACLGLFGLASFTAEQRTKEIGIRKVLGASVSNIIVLLTKEFTQWVLIANVIAWPLGYFVMRKWLEHFAYRIDIPMGAFIFSGLLVFGLSLLTVCHKAIKAALANPVSSLRYE
jgi:putative ABC transport system permease protein